MPPAATCPDSPLHCAGVTRLAATGIEIAWEAFGAPADDTVLLISGLGTQMIRWTRPFCAGLAARGYRVLRFDNRDSGRSTHLRAAPPDFAALAAALGAGQRPAVPYTLGDMAADVLGLLDALGLGRVHLVGRSMGGMIAQMLASGHPDRVLSLTSIMSSTGNPALPQAAPEVMALMMRPAPDPADDPRGFWPFAWPLRAGSPGRAFPSMRRPRAPCCWPKRVPGTTRAAPRARLRPWRSPGTGGRPWRGSWRRRW